MRIFGLDILRASAILLVLIGHLGHVGLLGNSYPMFLFGYFGVELFFVLSGFLIGQILIRELLLKGFTFSSLKKFWINRWMRTLPLYYLVLIIRMVIDGSATHFLHFIFLQNAQVMPEYDSSWFGESWSLAIEEYFYLSFPVLLFAASKLFKQVNTQMIATLLLIFTSCLAFRVFTVISYPTLDFENDIRKFTFVRLDSLAVGVVFAFLKLQLNTIFKFLQHRIVPVIALIVFLLLVGLGNILVYDFEGIKLIPSTVGIILNSLLLGFLLPYFDKIGKPKLDLPGSKWAFSFVHYTALFSYCLYLIHLPIYNLIIRSESVDIIWCIQMCAVMVILYALSALSYRYFEQPILEFRKRIS
jgi:peptidoglycan/LPS O-acetylase OafA/YrhL